MRPVHEGWVADLRALVMAAGTAEELVSDFLTLQAGSTAPYAADLGDAFALAWLAGRTEVADEIREAEFADEVSYGSQTFKEAQEFLRQKVSLPSKAWTDHLHQAHDRAFVVAGADSVALVEDIRGALDRSLGRDGGGLEAFRRNFDEIVARHGWDYKGGRNWRTRVIYETNLRTAHQAGRLAQMRDPDVVKARPYWQYVHGEIREPKQPRAEHLALDGKVWLHSDPIWKKIYPPNGWRCSCGVRTVSKAGLRRLGKDGPDPTPELKMRKVKDPTTGDLVEVPEGIDFGWGYQPGDTWERGLVPRELQQPLSLAQPELPSPVSPPLTDLGRPFAAPELPDGKPEEYYVERFLQRFGAGIGKGAMYRDKAGHAIVMSDQLFRNGVGRLKVKKGNRHLQIERLAEAIFDPDEIWVDWEDLPDRTRRLVRRYLRWDPQLAVYSAFEWSSAGWTGVTSFNPTKGRAAKPKLSYLENYRRGAMLFRRPK